jgi:FkbM family methyltransferase
VVVSHARNPPNGFLAQWILDQFPADYRGYAVDVGASDGRSVNTTWALEKSHAWMVLSVEANPYFRAALTCERAWVEMCACAAQPKEAAEFFINQDNPEAYSALKITKHATSQEFKQPWSKALVPVKTVDQLLTKWDFPRLDALCVDVEGGEQEVLKGCDLERWKPKVIISEAWDSGYDYPYLAPFGYKLVARCVHNDAYTLEKVPDGKEDSRGVRESQPA